MFFFIYDLGSVSVATIKVKLSLTHWNWKIVVLSLEKFTCQRFGFQVLDQPIS